ncbi:MAG TPA: type II toxin-antitoxin system VapC family toxin [Rubrobacter sp.]|nr:type II toxin-antitoxin system VapC family toxin [Rubrobacter sp.]
MTVIDASAEVAVLLNVSHEVEGIRERISRPGETLHVPHIFEIEILHALRSLGLHGTLSLERARLALSRLKDTQLMRHPHTPLMGRIWDLRERT